MKNHGFEMSHEETSKWFKEKFELETDEDSKDIADNICGNLYNYGFRVYNCFSSRKGELYRLENCIKNI